MKILNKIYLFLGLTAALASCSQEAPFTDDSPQGYGKILSSAISVKVQSNEIAVRSSELPNPADFTVDFFKADSSNEPVMSYSYAAMPDLVVLPAGKYIVSAYYGGNYGSGKKAAFETPYFYGKTEEIQIEKDHIVDNIGAIVCKPANVKVSVYFDAELVEAMGDGSKVSVKVGESGSLDFYPETSEDGYFAYDEGSHTLVAEFSGSIDGDETYETKTYRDVLPGNYYRITFRLHPAVAEPGTSLPGNIVTGDVDDPSDKGLKVDASVTFEDMTGDNTIDVSPDEEQFLEDDLRPGETPGGSTDTPEQPEQPAGKAPVITGQGVVLDVPNVNPTECSIKIVSDTGITDFTVDIISDGLTAADLELMGLSQHLDLINPGSMKEPLSNLGFPVEDEVIGKKEVGFSITNFLGLLAALGPYEHTFLLKVTDANGTTESRLIIRIQG